MLTIQRDAIQNFFANSRHFQGTSSATDNIEIFQN